MAKMWAGRTAGDTAAAADDFNSSIRFDARMYREDITGSMAHADMLAKCGILTMEEAKGLKEGLKGILDDMDAGRLLPDPEAEDIHMFVEEVLTRRIGDLGKKLHTARSRNDQVALDLRMYLRRKTDEITSGVETLAATLALRAEEYRNTIMPGYTHLQRAQPVTFGYHLSAYAMMLLRDRDRLRDARRRTNFSPIGACALAGTTYPTDRRYEAELLGFDGICENAMDAVADRDFAVETTAALSLLMAHLSRMAEELVLWSSWEFRFIELPEGYTTGSSIMPQKKNPDMAELIRGKTGRVYGDLTALLTVLKGLPLAYNKDMQEDKESVFDAVDTVLACLSVMTPMIAGLTAKADTMKKAVATGFLNATDLADYLVGKGIPFRAAYKVAGAAVALCLERGTVIEELPLAELQKLHPAIDSDVYAVIAPEVCLGRRTSEGGPAPDAVAKQIAYIRAELAK